MLGLHQEGEYLITEKSLGVSPANPELSILIPTWNNLEMLSLCIRSLQANSEVPRQIVLHINQGTDGTLEWAREKGIAFTASKVNIGVCHALNAARTLASADHLVFFNDDMYACPGWDTALMRETARLSHRSFMLSGTLIEPRKTGNNCVVVADYGRNPSEFREACLLGDLPGLGRADWQGSTWPPSVLHRDMWDLVGGMSTEYFPGFYSDPDLSMKLWRAGVRLFKGVGSSLVYHFGSVTTGRVRAGSGRRVFARKWGITSGAFTRLYLRRGSPWDGPLAEPSPGLPARIRNWLSARI